jgi:hypothetical protein
MFFDIFTSSFYDRIITGYFNIFYLVAPVLAPYFICYTKHGHTLRFLLATEPTEKNEILRGFPQRSLRSYYPVGCGKNRMRQILSL